MIRSRSDCCCPMTKSEKDDEHVFLKKKKKKKSSSFHHVCISERAVRLSFQPSGRWVFR